MAYHIHVTNKEFISIYHLLYSYLWYNRIKIDKIYQNGSQFLISFHSLTRIQLLFALIAISIYLILENIVWIFFINIGNGCNILSDTWV